MPQLDVFLTKPIEYDFFVINIVSLVIYKTRFIKRFLASG